MKYIIVYLLASVPLLALTIYSALPSANEPAPEVPEALGGQLDRDASAAETARRRATDDAAAVEQMRSGDLLGRGSISGDIGRHTPTSTRAVLDAWSAFEGTRLVMSGYQKTESTSADVERQRLLGFVRTIENRPKFSRIRDAAQRRLGDAEVVVARSAGERLAANSFEQARAVFDAARYEVCVGRCTQLVEEISDGGFTNITTRQVLALRDRAQYRLDWAKVAKPRPGENDDAWRERIEAFLKDHAAPVHPAEKQLRASLQGKMDDVRRAVAIATARHNVEQSIRALNRRDVAGIEQLVEAGESVVVTLAKMTGRKDITAAESQGLRREMTRRTRALVNTAFTAKKTTASDEADMQEVTQTGGSLLRGYFVLYEDKFYRHYTLRDDAARGDGNWKKLELADLADKPRLAMQWRCIARYAAYVKRNGRTYPTRQAWQGLLALCQQLDVELAEYRKIPGANTRAFSFPAEAKLARQVLSHWDRFETLVEK